MKTFIIVGAFTVMALTATALVILMVIMLMDEIENRRRK